MARLRGGDLGDVGQALKRRAIENTVPVALGRGAIAPRRIQVARIPLTPVLSGDALRSNRKKLPVHAEKAICSAEPCPASPRTSRLRSEHSARGLPHHGSSRFSRWLSTHAPSTSAPVRFGKSG